MIAGVCTAVADCFGLSRALVRIAFFGVGKLRYIVV
jgi:phage shock protein PspC (stress-responsive transcriptional regulator)